MNVPFPPKKCCNSRKMHRSCSSKMTVEKTGSIITGRSARSIRSATKALKLDFPTKQPRLDWKKKHGKTYAIIIIGKRTGSKKRSWAPLHNIPSGLHGQLLSIKARD